MYIILSKLLFINIYYTYLTKKIVVQNVNFTPNTTDVRTKIIIKCQTLA